MNKDIIIENDIKKSYFRLIKNQNNQHKAQYFGNKQCISRQFTSLEKGRIQMNYLFINIQDQKVIKIEGRGKKIYNFLPSFLILYSKNMISSQNFLQLLDECLSNSLDQSIQSFYLGNIHHPKI